MDEQLDKTERQKRIIKDGINDNTGPSGVVLDTSGSAAGSTKGKSDPFAAEKKSQEKPFKSRGWKIHNEITYRFIDWILNSSVGVAFGMWSSRTEAGHKYFQTPVSNFYKKILSPFLKSENTKAEGAKWGTMITGIMAGGFTIIPLMMAMENKKVKKKIVRWLDEKTYGKEEVANNPKFEESYRRIDEEPKKGFWVGMGARFVALAPLIAAVSIPATNKPFMKYGYGPVGKASQWVTEKVGIKPERMGSKVKNFMEKTSMEHLDGDPHGPLSPQSNWQKLHETIGFDFGLTIIYAFLHEISYKFMASIFGSKKKKDDAKSKTEHEQGVPTPAMAAADQPSLPGMEPAMAGGFADKYRSQRSEPALASNSHLDAVQRQKNDGPGMVTI